MYAEMQDLIMSYTDAAVRTVVAWQMLIRVCGGPGL
jgi:hypothetical protein